MSLGGTIRESAGSKHSMDRCRDFCNLFSDIPDVRIAVNPGCATNDILQQAWPQYVVCTVEGLYARCKPPLNALSPLPREVRNDKVAYRPYHRILVGGWPGRNSGRRRRGTNTKSRDHRGMDRVNKRRARRRHCPALHIPSCASIIGGRILVLVLDLARF